MTIYNRNFAKPAADGTPLYGPMPLGVEIQRHDEWDEPILDPETGEPTGETERKTRDWVEKRTVVRPKAKDFKLMGYMPLAGNPPPDPPQGQHYERSGTIVLDGDCYKWVYILVPDPPAPPRVFSKLKVVAALTNAGVWQQVKAWIEEAGLYDLYLAAQEFAEDNEYFAQGLAALKPVVGWTDGQVEALLAQCVKEGY
ncbi:MAG: hypothetical protein II649_02915 [Kiritimatiellae bacterium]|nr:hypothetical protein [Kiritimatiellia bacterium]